MSDDELFALIADGNIGSLEQFYRSTYQSVFAFILSMVKCRHTAEDLMHDTYMRVFERAGQYQIGTNIKTWVMTIAKNITYDYFRKTKNILPFDESPTNDNTLEHYDSCDIYLKHFELENALVKLSGPDAQIAVLYAVCGYKHKEIAQFLSIPEGTVRRRYRKAIKQLAETIGGEADG